jgi:hypothetical protein
MGIDRRIDGLPTVSASKIKVYKTCARQYQHKYITPHNDRPEDHKNVAALLGTALHKAIEEYYTEQKSPIGVFQQVMAQTVEEWDVAGYTIKALDYYPRAIKVGKDILTKFDWSRFTPQELEYSFTLPFPTIENPITNITGFIDLIDMSGAIVDHKSSSYAPNMDALANDPQFLIYAWAMKQITGNLPYKVIWNHLRTGKLYEAAVLENYDTKIDNLVLDIQALLTHGPYFARKNLDSVCLNQCSFYELCYGKKVKDMVELNDDD